MNYGEKKDKYLLHASQRSTKAPKIFICLQLFLQAIQVHGIMNILYSQKLNMCLKNRGVNGGVGISCIDSNAVCWQGTR